MGLLKFFWRVSLSCLRFYSNSEVKETRAGSVEGELGAKGLQGGLMVFGEGLGFFEADFWFWRGSR